MLKQRKQAFETIQPLFVAWEVSNDLATADGATCIAELLRTRIQAGLPIGMGRDMFDKLVDALNANVGARKLLVEAHELTPELVKQLGLERMFGDVSPCPPTDMPRAGLTVVPTSSAG
jgi:hypothetical protein